MTDTPIIQVNATPTKDQIEAGFRDFVKVAGPIVAILAATGWGKKVGLSDLFTAFVGSIGAVSTIVAIVWGQIKTRTLSKKAAAMAVQLPNEIAQIK